jgi:ABC-type amino acid transport substrate-binding protein
MNKAWLLVSLCAAMLLALPSWGDPAGAQSPVEAGVTTFTDGLAYPNGEISKAITELAVELDESGKLRLLPIMGSAGVANVRDLLRFRGADFAIINNDVFALKDVSELYPEAREKLRYITKLRAQKVVLLARKDINALDQLAGKKVLVFGPEAIAKRSAATIFDLLEVNAAITHVPDAGADGQIGDAAAIFFFHTDTSWLPRDLAQSGEFHLIPVPMNSALSAFYRKAEIKPGELGAYSGSEAIATIKIDTILATFDWLPRHGRYADVAAFIDGFFAAIPKFRRNGRLPIWRETDPQAEVLGWKQHAYAATAKESVPRPEEEPEPVAANTESAGSEAAAVRLSVISQPPLTDQQSDNGGLLTELAKAALERTAWPGAGEIVVRWDENRVDQANGIVTKKSADLALPWMGGECEAPEKQNSETAFFCEGILASDPIFKVLVAFFARADSDFDPTAEEHMIGRTLCRPAELDLTPLSELAKQLIRDGKLTLVRPPSLIDCLSLVDRQEADALFVNELEGKRVITHLGLSERFRMIEGAISVQDVHIGLPSDRPGAKEFLAALNEGINKLKAEDLYSRIIVKHLSPAPKLGAAQ